MQSQTARLASFSPTSRSKATPRWPHPSSFLATPKALAAAGFYFNPSPSTPDAVSCFLCNKGLADWEPDDDPALIHVQKCPNCPWAILACESDEGKDGSFKFASSSRLPTSNPMEHARLATFGPETKRWWPHESRDEGPHAKAMAKAGFVFTPAGPKDDTCLCIYCLVELGGWQPEDDPMEEHRRRQAKNGPCPFFTSTTPHTKQRPRSKSKPPPPTVPATSSAGGNDEEHLPTANARNPAIPVSKKSSKSKSSKKPKSIKQEVIEEYHVVLDEDEDAPPKPRPKPRRTSSRSSSRSRAGSQSHSSSRSRASSALSTPEDANIDIASSSTKKSKSKTPKRDASPSPSTTSRSRSKKRPDSDNEQSTRRSTRSRSRPPPNEDDGAKKSKHGSREKTADAETRNEEGKSSVRPSRSKGKSKTKTTEEKEKKEPNDEPVRKRGKIKTRSAEDETEEHTRGRNKNRTKTLAEKDTASTLLKPETTVKPAPEVQGEGLTTGQRSNGTALGQSLQTKHATKEIVPHSEDQVTAYDLPSQSAPFSAPSPTSPPPQRNGVVRPQHDFALPPTHMSYRTSESPDDEDFAREELALEAQALALMTSASTPPFANTTIFGNAGDSSKMATMDIDSTPLPPTPRARPATPPPQLPPPQALPIAEGPFSRPLPSVPPLPSALTAEERSMTVEQWIRQEMDRQYERFRSDGQAKIEAFKRRAEEVAVRIKEM